MAWVSNNYFGVTGTRFALGRAFTQTEEVLGEVILSHRFWMKRFNGDPTVIGRNVVVNNHPVTIIGVTEPGFTGSTVLAPEIWAPFTMMKLLDPRSQVTEGRPFSVVMALGRLKPGITVEQAQADLARVAARLAKEFPDSHRERGVAVARSSRFPGETRLYASAFIGVLGLLTLLGALVASANIAGLMLAHGAVRQREFAVRTALGADRRRLVRDLLLEQLSCFGAGGLGGAFLCLWLVDLLRTAVPRLPVPVELDLSVNPGALAFAIGFSLVLGLLFSVGPALNSSRFNLVAALRQQEQPSGARIFGLRGLFLILQLSLSLALLTAAAGLTKSLWCVAHRSPGFDTDRVELVEVDLRNAGFTEETGRQFLDQLVASARNLPGVESAATTVAIPLSGGGFSFGPLFPDAARKQPPAIADWNLVSPDYFATMSIPLVRGRDFKPSDRAGAPLVGIVNETFARVTWPGQNAIGQFLYNGEGKPIEIVGVARDSKYRSVGEAPRLHFYAPAAQNYFFRQALLVKSRDRTSLLPRVQELLHQLQPNLPIHNAQSLGEAVALGTAPQRIAASVALAAGLLALVLAATGIYGATLFWVAHRTREFGVRAALGAAPRSLLRLALSGSLRITAVATVLGLAGAFGLLQILNSLFGGISAELSLFAVCAALFAALALAASLMPARRAARVDPLIALRAE
jgi:predicted permease